MTICDIIVARHLHRIGVPLGVLAEGNGWRARKVYRAIRRRPWNPLVVEIERELDRLWEEELGRLREGPSKPATKRKAPAVRPAGAGPIRTRAAYVADSQRVARGLHYLSGLLAPEEGTTDEEEGPAA